jgi:O-succinylbenzoic acid--CoA ligase
MTDGHWPRQDLLTRRVDATPDRCGLVDADRDRSWTYRELDRRISGWTRTLSNHVASPETGDEHVDDGPSRVGFLLDTRPETLELVFAAHRQGYSVVLLNVQQPADRLATQVARTDPALVVCGADTEESAVEATDRDLPVVNVDEPNRAERDHLEPADGAPAERREVGADAERLVAFTSGTTGEPKGVRLTAGNLVASATASAFRLGVAREDRWLLCLPTYHVGGLSPLLRSTLYGTTTVLQREFDPGTTARVIESETVTGVSLVPTMLVRLLDAGWHPPAHLRFVLLGGAAATPSLLERCERRGVPVYPTYGLTETASQVATATPAQAFEREVPATAVGVTPAGTVGQPLVNTTVRVVDDDGNPVDPGERGEVVVSGPTVTPGYLDDERTAAGPHGLHTGDLGVCDAEGHLWVVGRVDDLVVTGGENVHPETVAGAVRDHPAVAEAAVVGLPDEEWGQRVATLVVPADGDDDASTATLAPGDVRAHCRDRLADYEVPKTVEVTDALPRTASGTVDREAVREALSGADG